MAFLSSSSLFRCQIKPLPMAFDEFRKICHQKPTNDDENDQRRHFISLLIKRLNIYNFNDTMNKTIITKKDFDEFRKICHQKPTKDDEVDFVNEFIIDNYAKQVEHSTLFWSSFIKEEGEELTLSLFENLLIKSYYISDHVYGFLLNPKNKEYLDLTINELEKYEKNP